MDGMGDLKQGADTTIVGAARNSLLRAYTTNFEHKVIKGRHTTGLARSKNFKKYIREFGAMDPTPDQSWVHPKVWAFAEKAAK